jgi:hypothetical protein
MSETVKPAFRPSNYDDDRPDNDALRDYANNVAAPAYGNTGIAPKPEPEVRKERIAEEPENESRNTSRIKRSSSRRLTKENADQTEVSLGIKIPAYVRKQLRQKAFTEDVTARYLILNSLRETYNVTVYADDLMEDKRKRK